MRFLVIATSSGRVELADLGDAPLRANKYRAQLVADGKIVTHAHIAGHRAHMWIYEVDSVDELDAVISSDPMSAHLDATPQVYPLLSQTRMNARADALELSLQEQDSTPSTH